MAAAKPKAQMNANEKYEAECVIFVPKVGKTKLQWEAILMAHDVKGVKLAEFTVENELRVAGTKEINWSLLVDELKHEYGAEVRQLTPGPYVDAGKS